MQFFCQRHDMLVGIQRGSVLQAIDLRVDLGSDFRIAVADRDRQDAAKKIEILVSVQVPQVLHFAAVGHQRLLKIIGDRRPQNISYAALQFLRCGIALALQARVSAVTGVLTKCPLKLGRMPKSV